VEYDGSRHVAQPKLQIRETPHVGLYKGMMLSEVLSELTVIKSRFLFDKPT